MRYQASVSMRRRRGRVAVTGLASDGGDGVPPPQPEVGRARRNAYRSFAFSDRVHQVWPRRAGGSDIDGEQGGGLGGTCVARDAMDGARWFPPRISHVERLLGSVADLRGDG